MGINKETQELFQQLAESSEDPVHIQPYTGRYMYNQECFALVGSRADCLALVSNVISTLALQLCVNDDEEANFEKHEQFSKIVNELITDFQIDSMGKDIVMYWVHNEFLIDEE